MADAQPDLRTIANQDGAVILNTTTGGITTINSTGALIWQALERGEALEAIAANLAIETEEQMDSLKRDIEKFMEALREQKLLSC
jgi:predicted Rdx family selenoprotein